MDFWTMFNAMTNQEKYEYLNKQELTTKNQHGIPADAKFHEDYELVTRYAVFLKKEGVQLGGWADSSTKAMTNAVETINSFKE